MLFKLQCQQIWKVSFQEKRVQRFNYRFLQDKMILIIKTANQLYLAHTMDPPLTRIMPAERLKLFSELFFPLLRMLYDVIPPG